MQFLIKYLKVDKDNKLVIYSVMLAFIIGTLLIVIKTPFSWYDERTHITRAIQLSNGDFKVKQNGSNIRVGGYICVDENEFLNIDAPVRKNCYKLGWWTDYRVDTMDAEGNNMIFRPATNTIPYNPICYLPYLLVSAISHLMKIAPVYEYLLMRIVGFLSFFTLYLLVIRISTEAKIPLSLFLLSPTIITSFMSVTADNYGIVICALWFVMLFEFIKKMRNGMVAKKDYTYLILVSVLVVFSKLPNFIFLGLIIPLCIIIYINRQSSKNQIITLIIVLLFEAFFTILWLFIVGDVNTGGFWLRNVDTREQLIFILSDIRGFVKMLINFLLNYSIFSQIQIGYTYSNHNNMPYMIGIAFYIGLYMAARFGENEKIKDPDEILVGEKWLVYCGMLLLIMFIIMISIILYLQFSEVGSRSIDGVQPRYFLPVYYFIVIMLPYMYKRNNYKKSIIVGLTILPTIYYLLLSVRGLMY